ncbi:hypothetical protein DBR32_09105 [Taibaiella sp. KBW10]|uniref:SanA/YdcF family protein n=1 Tax=Taibaiella sp. KBW10 TaxID=2153357 RepID=UPI000F594F3B|nr:ElyC/SanA/YdcF family protein [Taibaiella sp. KBW10]RQO30864.1 hypothetical protein DBR32_09105 [Taibaiella sp. KBW10]
MKKIKMLVLVLLLISLCSVALVYSIKKEANRYCYRNIDRVPAAYTGIIFGAGIVNNQPSKYLKDRLDAGIALYKAGKVKRLLVSGDNGQDEYDEVSVMKQYCADHGVPKADIFADYAGFDTYSTVYRAKDLFKVADAIMISQNYHLDRAVYLGKSMNINSYGFAADKGDYVFLFKNKVREGLAILKSFVDVHRGRKPKYYGGDIDIQGPSNFDKK